VDLEEELEDLAIADAGRVKDDLDGFGVPAMIAIGGVGGGTAGVPDPRRQNTVATANKVLHAPEAAAGENSALLGHFPSSTWSR
jgi:hypothetical protein